MVFFFFILLFFFFFNDTATTKIYTLSLHDALPICMEGVIAAKNADRDTPVIWLSDDEGFGAQSYRLGCTYFHKKPIPLEKLKEALHKCRCMA